MANAASRGWFHKKGRDESAPPAADAVDTLRSSDDHSPVVSLAAFDAIVGARLGAESPENGSHSTEIDANDLVEIHAGVTEAGATTELIDDEKEAVFHVKQSADETSAPTVSSAEDDPTTGAIDWDAATHAALTEDAAASTPSHAPLAEEVATLTRRRQAIAELKLPLPEKTRVLTISNQKGGVGKTTTAVNLAAALARLGAKVLVIDLDPQGNASTALGVEHRADVPSIYNVIIEDLPLSAVVQKSPEEGELYCVPANIHLAGAEIELVSLVAREQRLRRALDLHIAEMDEPYDYVFIDCPPSLGLLTINAFVAASEVLIPIQCEYYALEGLSQLLKNIEMIEKHLNPVLRVSTILLTMYDSRTNLANQVAQDVRDHFPQQVLGTIIPRSVRVSEAPSYGQSVISYDTNSTGSLSYQEAAAEMARRGAPVVTPRTGSR
ncbi:cellulose biosynthesis protein BcsQ [Microterricola gilva]|uniref:Cellulose biosynthesis protein BcsQ n=1 Tax=Microterricola gilva TaxID=393267 RepID=A0A4Q8AQS0_9MICO|nr:cellulose biosynthesis protein BcsQ [Microterricola gilva]